MPYNYGGQDVKCPFYMYERERAIHCEGLIKNARNTINTFNGKKDLNIHKSKFCNYKYQKCALYQALLGKYE